MALWRTKDGVFKIRYYLNGRSGPKRQETLGKITYAAAVRIHKERIAAAASGRVSHRRIRFSDLAEEYLKTHGARISESGCKRAEEVIRLHLNPRFGSKYADALKPIDIDRYRQERLTEGAKPATVNREWNICKAILNKGEAWGVLERNPIRRGAVSVFRVDNAKLVFFEVGEWSQLITAFDDESRWVGHVDQSRRLGPVIETPGKGQARRFGGGRKGNSAASHEYLRRLRECVPAMKALLYTGSRLGEVLALRWEDVDWKRGVLTIRQQKTRKSKTVPISSGLQEVLEAVPKGSGSTVVFRRGNGAAIRKHELQRAFEVAKRIAGIRSELTPHSIRHTFASWLAIAGRPLRTIQELLGHGDLRMTLRYAHLSPAHLREAVEVIVSTVDASTTSASGSDLASAPQGDQAGG